MVGDTHWLFLVPLKGGRWHIIPQLAVYTTYIPLIVLAEPGGPHMLPIPPFKGTSIPTIEILLMLQKSGYHRLRLVAYLPLFKTTGFDTHHIQTVVGKWISEPSTINSIKAPSILGFDSTPPPQKKKKGPSKFYNEHKHDDQKSLIRRAKFQL